MPQTCDAMQEFLFQDARSRVPAHSYCEWVRSRDYQPSCLLALMGGAGNDWAESLGAPLAADSGQNAKLAQNQHIDVYRLVVAHQASVPLVRIGARAVAFDVK